MAKVKTQDAAPVPAEPTHAAVWKEQPEMMRDRALAVLIYLAQVARQVTADPDGDAYSPDCVRAIGWNMLRMVGAIRAAERAASPLDEVTYELARRPHHPVNALDHARECLSIIAEHRRYGDPMGFMDEDDEKEGIAVLVEMALAFLTDAETAFAERMGLTPAPSQEGTP